MAVTLVAIALIVLLWSINRWKWRATLKLTHKLSSNKVQTFLGCGKIYNKQEFLACMDVYGKKYGKSSIFWMGPIPTFLSSDPQTIKDIFTSKNCVDKPQFFYEGISHAAGEGSISSKDPIWSAHRKILNKAFNYKVLISFLPLFSKLIDGMTEEVETSLERHEQVDLLRMFRKLTLKTASNTVLSRDMDLSKHDSTALTESFQKMIEYVMTAILTVPMRIKLVSQIADTFVFKDSWENIAMIKKYIDESIYIKQSSYTTDPSYLPEVNSVLDFLLTCFQQNSMEMSDVQSETMHLFAAAFDTTSYSSYLALVLLAMYPEYQERAYEEVISVFPDDDTEMTVEQIDKLVFLEMVFNETMRLFPPIPAVGRLVSNENVRLSNGLTLPVGQAIIIDIYSLHRSRDIWGPNADSFNPENFLPANVDTRHPYTFIPFTKGLRFCLGWKYGYLFVKMSLAKTIKHFKFSTDFKYEDLVPENHTSLRLKKEPHVRLERRTRA